MDKKRLGQVFLFASFIAGLSIIGAFFWYQQTNTWLNNAIKIQGTVVGFTEHRTNNGPPTYAPKVEYTYQEQTYLYYHSFSTNMYSYQYNQEVAIYIDPNNPEEALLESPWLETYIGPISLAGVSALLSVIFFFAGLRIGKQANLVKKNPYQVTYVNIEHENIIFSQDDKN